MGAGEGLAKKGFPGTQLAGFKGSGSPQDWRGLWAWVQESCEDAVGGLERT